MAEKSFAINTEPHTANVGPHVLKFQPEAAGAEFAEAYVNLTASQKRLTAAGEDAGADELRAVTQSLRAFLARFLIPESAEVFSSLTLPDRVLVQLLEWVAELYGGGQGNGGAPGGPSSGS